MNTILNSQSACCFGEYQRPKTTFRFLLIVGFFSAVPSPCSVPGDAVPVCGFDAVSYDSSQEALCAGQPTGF